MHVLVVEDEERLAEAVRRALERDGHTVDVAHDGLQGLDLARSGTFDALVLDVMLPGLDGFEICRRLRAEGNPVPILILTARDAVADRVRGLDSGADDYLVKPFALVELQARVRALGRRAPRPPDPPVVEVGPVRFHPATGTVTVAGRPVELRPRERALLELLLRNPGRLFSRDEILDRVWGFDREPPASNVVDVHVCQLRRKLGPASRLIESVRGYGYRLVAPGRAWSGSPAAGGAPGQGHRVPGPSLSGPVTPQPKPPGTARRSHRLPEGPYRHV
ncbi:two component transcriptional regulator, winged helix family [Thermaerobacter marianensis DSM 12885]|uniref:Stage 0 sporulation protein A homolog n=1 Tax=Thermaerobacter marianensis (strain ATCC 700841 / DSM 12885 / JCM 10246 / 7p75a) TaxID=644966 RepID=E6SJY9_THEM7|nr:response regulator transcription factor [Thermaerobacter marianensis]ADU52222.1 two component transcriptional regulator, winged helix family [Thermaerobacter marianensis DSM 12885]